MALLRKLKNARSYCFQAPWCVPEWGWAEFRAVASALAARSVRRGPLPDRFAGSLKQILGRRFAIPVNRGREAIYLALRALDVRPSDEVVLPAYICSSVLDAVVEAGAMPVYADIDSSLHLTAASVEAALTPRTRCVIVPHLFGNAAPVDEIEELLRSRGISLIDDAAQSLGARRAGRPVGSFGEFGVVCGGPAKPLGAAAGALLLMDDPGLFQNATRVPRPFESRGAILRRLAAFWFWRRLRRYTVLLEVLAGRFFGPGNEPGCHPHPLSNIDASILCEQLARLSDNRERRLRNALVLLRLLKPLGWQVLSDLGPDGMLVKLILLLPESAPDIRQVIALFARAGIECQGGYAPCYLKMGRPPGAPLPFTDALWRRVLCLPLQTALRRESALAALVANWHTPTSHRN